MEPEKKSNGAMIGSIIIIIIVVIAAVLIFRSNKKAPENGQILDESALNGSLNETETGLEELNFDDLNIEIEQ